MMKKLAAAGLSAALIFGPLAAFAQNDAAPAAPAATDAAPAAPDAGAKPAKPHKAKKHHAKKEHKKMKKEEAPASTDGAAPADQQKQQ